MLGTGRNIRILNLDSIIVIEILLFGLLIYSNSEKNTNDLQRKPASTCISVIENNADYSPGIRLQVFQKAWILNRDNFNLLAFNRNQLSENMKTGIKVSRLRIIRQGSHKIPQFILLYHLFPADTDEPPLLS
jgi:hypothetical protein